MGKRRRCADKFGSFILHTAVDSEEYKENALSMLSESSSECVSRSESSGKQQQQQLLLKLDTIGFPSCYNIGKPSKVTVVGSCNGFICLFDEQPYRFSLWNPATRQFRRLPRPKFFGVHDHDGYPLTPNHPLFAFGFDAQTKDYNVVLLSFFNRRMLNIARDAPMECLCNVQVYSLRTDSWRPLENITTLPATPYSHPPNSSSPGQELFYLNGTCFFTAKLFYSSAQSTPVRFNNDRFLISLDLTKQTITPIQLPPHHPSRKLYLCNFGKKIAYFDKTFNYTKVYDVNDPGGSWERFDVYLFDEHKSKWVSLVDFRIQLGLPGEKNIPRGISNDGVFAFLETEIPYDGLGDGKKKNKMKLYNMVTKELQQNFLFCDQEVQVMSKLYAYKPSLASIEAAAAAAADDMVIDDMVIGLEMLLQP